MNVDIGRRIKIIINKAEDILSHYMYNILFVSKDEEEYRVSKLLREDKLFIYSIKDFNRNLLEKWLFTNKVYVNNYTKSQDDLTLPKEKYVALTETDGFHMSVEESDECLCRIALNPTPPERDWPQMRPCIPDSYCCESMFSSPSIAYSLSHRLLNFLGRHFWRRCHISNRPEFDEISIETLCASMYREAVYVARRGFFARDIFVEHVAFCAFLGYEEFYRSSWFRKISSWIDKEGCVREFPNFDVNRTKFLISIEEDPKLRDQVLQYSRKQLNNDCYEHVMALVVIAMAHAIRHAVHVNTNTVPSISSDEE